MAKKKAYQNLYVYMNGHAVAQLAREISGQLIFTYEQSWLNSTYARPISLSLPLTEMSYSGEMVENYFDNLLPDNDNIRARIQTRFNTPSKKCFDLLSSIGHDCIGALQLLPEPQLRYSKKFQATPISENEIASLLKHYQTAPLGMSEKYDFRLSLAGAQEKSALLLHRDKWYLPKGSMATSHIIKLPIGYIKHAGIDLSTSVENEWLCLQILSGYALPVNRAKIVQFAEVKTLVVERFDREWVDNERWLLRLPQEDMCQALGKSSALKYESDGGLGIEAIMTLLRGSIEAESDRKQFMKSVFLFWVMGAIDGHAKNFSLSIGLQGRYRLTPLYDVISAYPLAAKRQIEWKALKMAMALKGKNRHYEWSTIKLRHWLAMAERCQFPSVIMQDIIHEVYDNMEKVIDDVASQLPKKFPDEIAGEIFSNMMKVRDRAKNRLV